MIRERSHAQFWPGVALALMVFGACGDDDSAATAKPDGGEMPAVQAAGAAPGTTDAAATGSAANSASSTSQETNASCGAGQFDSTFAAIQKVIFEGHNCTNNACHGAAATGGLDLRADVAYDSLIEVKASLGTAFRVMPGEPDESVLFRKLKAATDPDGVMVEGSAMPVGEPPLSAEHLEVMRRWIEAGASRDGSIGDAITGKSDGIAELLGSCLPEVTPIEIKRLPAPSAEEGLQIPMAPFMLPGEKEVDVCFAQYYDVSDVVPAEFQDAKRGVFFVNGQRTRQDPQSHHLVIKHSGLGEAMVKDPSFGSWACRGGERNGQDCDPLKQDACSAGVCASEPQHKAACIGFGPMNGNSAELRTSSIATAQTAQYYRAPREGLYETIPLRGILYMNSHAFNLTKSETQLHAWINLFYAKSRQHEVRTLAITDKISIANGQAPFTKETHCAKWVAPRNAAMYTLSSHTHKRGSNFTVMLPDGTQVYQSAIYSDPVEKMFNPPMRFESAEAEARTLTYCAEYNNGATKDGSPDLKLVTRLSTMPDRTTCTPVACTGGKIGAACDGASDNASCDSSPGAGDGVCDACPITAGQTTENEMFVLSPSVVVE
jgi:hypothetical protein